MMRRPPRSPPFPYPTLSRSNRSVGVEAAPPESIADHRLEIPVDVESRVAGERRADLGCHAEDAKKIPARLDRRHAHRVVDARSEEHTSELQSQSNLECRPLL